MPDAEQIGRQDAAETIDALDAAIPAYSGGTAIWSGNPFYIGLGIEDSWAENILDTTGDGYDLAVAVKSMQVAPAASSSVTRLRDLFGLLVGQGFWGLGSATAAAFEAAAATTTYLDAAYGPTDLRVVDLQVGSVQAGSSVQDTFYAGDSTGGSAWLHTGAGDDVIYAFSDPASGVDRAGVFDGGDDHDLVSFLYSTTYDGDGDGVTVRVQNWTSEVPFSALVEMPFGGEAALFNIERLNLSDDSDTLEIESESTTLEAVDGAGQGSEKGDTMDLSGLGVGVYVNLAANELLTGEMSLSVFDFENVIGSAQADTITGDAGTDFVTSTGTLEGVYVDLVNGMGQGGDAQGDTYDSVEGAIGSDYSDEIDVLGGAQMYAAGGGDVDVFYVDGYGDLTDGPTVLWGGAGDDQFLFAGFGAGNPLGIMVANVQNLTVDNFSQFDISMLNLGNNVDWSQIDVVLLNPEAGDKQYFPGDTGLRMGVGTGSHMIDVSGEGYITGPGEGHGTRETVAHNHQTFYSDEGICSTRNAHGSPTAASTTVVGSYDVDFLGSQIGTVFGGGANVWLATAWSSDCLDASDNWVVTPEDEPWYDVLYTNAPDYTGTFTTHWSAGDVYTSWADAYQWIDFIAYPDGTTIDPAVCDGDARPPYDNLQDIGTFTGGSFDRRFIAGCVFEGTTLVSSYTVGAAMPQVGTDTGESMQGGEYDGALNGKRGNDTYTGGPGSDTYIFATGDGADVVTDFEAAKDGLLINTVMITDLTSLPTGVSGATTEDGYVLAYGTDDTILIAATPELEAAYPEHFSTGQVITDTAEGAEIALAAGDMLLLNGVLASQLTESQFMFA